MNHVIAYCSPNGSTRHVAEVISESLARHGIAATAFDLGKRNDGQRALEACLKTEQSVCLWVGSPVYVDHMVPPVEHFILSLPEQTNNFAVPFVTWGGVNSGVALHEMGAMLSNKGFVILGAAKVIAVHSSLWRSDRPLGAGHPNEEDNVIVQGLVDKINEKLSTLTQRPVSLDVLNYQPEEIQREARGKSIALAKQIYPALAAESEKCSQCGECAEICPAGVITLDPYPQFDDDCFLCLKCVRECPESAIPFDTTIMEQRIRGMAAAIQERPPTQIFV